MAKTINPPTDVLLSDLLKIHISEDFLTHFDLHKVKNKPDCYELILHEKEHLLPSTLQGKKDVVLDGFCDSISILSHSFSLKKIYLIFKRRRWKISGSNKHYSNTYDLHPRGAKLTRLLASFLKGGH